MSEVRHSKRLLAKSNKVNVSPQKKQQTKVAKAPKTQTTTKRKNKSSDAKENIRKTPENIVDSSQTDDSSDIDSEDEDFYQKIQNQRRKLEQEKLKIIQDLNLHQAALDLQSSLKSNSGARRKTEKREAGVPVRKSRRLQNIKPEDKDKEGWSASTEVSEPKAQRVTDQEHKIDPVVKETTTKKNSDPEETNNNKESSKYTELIEIFKSELKLKFPDENLPVDSFTKKLESNTSSQCVVEKVVQSRIYAIDIYPSHSDIIMAAGGREGDVGIWNLDTSYKGDDKASIFSFFPHSSPVKCLRFAPDAPHKLYSCSYDGMFRCTDLTSETVSKAIHDDETYPPMYFDFIGKTSQSFILAKYGGDVMLCDTRESEDKFKTYGTGMRSLRGVSVHPVDSHYFAVSGNDKTLGSALIFDMRKLLRKASHPVVTLHGHKKAANSAIFSPITGNKLVTCCYDDRLRVYNTSVIGESASKPCVSIHHNNHTGRWLAPFQPAWHPTRDDIFVMGSMHKPRQVEIFDSDLQLQCVLNDTEVMKSVCSLNRIHPSRDVVVGGNSSGRVFIFGQ
uniref:WD repeat-containing protein 76 n=1 Tax=Ciona intestinalis TaxID=7719 RepID=F7B4Q5_CIOIN